MDWRAIFWRAILAGILLALSTGLVQANPPPPDLAALKAKYVRPTVIPFPKDNKFTEAKRDLGWKLFFDPRLSGSETISCASCHSPVLGWGDELPLAIGSAGTPLQRRSPTILNVAWAEALFWDGRAGTLEQQASTPILSAAEMNQSMPRLIAALTRVRGYRDAFAAAFPGEPVSATTIAKAIATFERTIVSGQTPFDRWIAGDETAIEQDAKRGFILFNTSAHCSACHSGWRFTDDSFHDIGLPGTDIGRGALIKGVEPLMHAFKTPGLRDVDARGPYMHNGSILNLTAVIRHYDDGFIHRDSLSKEIYPLHLSGSDIPDLVAFLHSLTSGDAPIEPPVLPADAMN